MSVKKYLVVVFIVSGSMLLTGCDHRYGDFCGFNYDHENGLVLGCFSVL